MPCCWPACPMCCPRCLPAICPCLPAAHEHGGGAGLRGGGGAEQPAGCAAAGGGGSCVQGACGWIREQRSSHRTRRGAPGGWAGGWVGERAAGPQQTVWLVVPLLRASLPAPPPALHCSQLAHSTHSMVSFRNSCPPCRCVCLCATTTTPSRCMAWPLAPCSPCCAARWPSTTAPSAPAAGGWVGGRAGGRAGREGRAWRVRQEREHGRAEGAEKQRGAQSSLKAPFLRSGLIDQPCPPFAALLFFLPTQAPGVRG